MILDVPNLVAGGMIGFVVGFFANAAYARYHTRRAQAGLRRKFEHIAGSYIAYPFIQESDNMDYSRPIGRCHVTYSHENVLLLEYEEVEHPNTWQGIVWMETPFFGSMAWRYIRLAGRQPPAEHRNGFKRCMVLEAPDPMGEIRTYFYLLGEPPFGREALQKVD